MGRYGPASGDSDSDSATSHAVALSHYARAAAVTRAGEAVATPGVRDCSCNLRSKKIGQPTPPYFYRTVHYFGGAAAGSDGGTGAAVFSAAGGIGAAGAFAAAFVSV